MDMNKYLQPKINQKIIKFFQENPSSIDTSRGIATWINENVNKTERALKKLAEARILVAHGSDAMSAYGYTTNRQMISKIETSLEKFKKAKIKKHH